MYKVLLACLAVILCGSLAAQTSVEATKAQLSVPFGTADGFLVRSADQLIFVNAKNPGDSFAMSRSAIANIEIRNDVATVELREAFRDRTRYPFRLSDSAMLSGLSLWRGPMTASAAPATRAPEPATDTLTYQVRHKHFRGGCDGRLLIKGNTIAFESLTKVEHSRQLDLRDVKELKRKNPYELSLKPFTGNEYDFELLGTGMSSRDYQDLVERVASQRASR